MTRPGDEWPSCSRGATGPPACTTRRAGRIATIDGLGGRATFTYDAADQLVALTDAESQTTTYQYDAAGRKIKETYADHVAGTSAGDADYGIVELSYDAAGRLQRRSDQLGDTCTQGYDLGGRLSHRDYRTRVNSPSGTISDIDTFTYDGVGRMLTAESGRYGNAVAIGLRCGRAVAERSADHRRADLHGHQHLRRGRPADGPDLSGRQHGGPRVHGPG